jgi:hypothetical protein
MLIKRISGWIIVLALLAACTSLPQTAFDQPEIAATPQGDPTPVWDLVERSINEESDQPPYVVNARWPNLVGDPAISMIFNAEIDRRVNAAVSSFLETVSQQADTSGIPPKSYLTLDYDLTLNEDGLVSVYLMLDTYIAISAHPFPSSQSLNYHLEQGRFLMLADLFDGDVDPLGVILPVVEADLLVRDLGFTPGLAEGVLEAREHWNLLPEGLRINFDVYEVAPYAAGHQTVLITWEDLVPYISEDSPIHPLILD